MHFDDHDSYIPVVLYGCEWSLTVREEQVGEQNIWT
jgi:hypothetical protein